MPELNAVEGALSAAVDWFLHSGIQSQAPGARTHGGFHAYYEADEGRYAYQYAEITGYALTMLAHLHEACGGEAAGPVRETLARHAGLALDWLRCFARDERSRAYRCRYEWAHDEFAPLRVCTFDNAMCLNGVVSWARLRGDGMLWDEARALAAWLLGMQNRDGSFNVRTVGPAAKLENTYATWSTQIGSFLSKGVIGLLNLERETGDGALRDAARRACDLALRFQAPEGRFLTHIVERDTLQHPHLYTVEGLLVGGTALEEPRYLDAAFRGIDWSLSTQLEDGGFPSTVRGAGGQNEHQRMDIQAQVLRAALWARRCGYAPDMGAVEGALTRLLAAQSQDERPALRGGFLYGHDDDGRALPHPNSWVTMFAMQALMAYTWAVQDEEPADPFLLV